MLSAAGKEPYLLAYQHIEIQNADLEQRLGTYLGSIRLDTPLDNRQAMGPRSVQGEGSVLNFL